MDKERIKISTLKNLIIYKKGGFVKEVNQKLDELLGSLRYDPSSFLTYL